MHGGSEMHSVHGRKGSGPSIHRSQSRPWGVTFHASCRASRLLSLQIRTGIITRQPMVKVDGPDDEDGHRAQNCGDDPGLVVTLDNGGHEHGKCHAQSQEPCNSGEVPQAERTFMSSGGDGSFLSVSWLET